MSGGVKRDNVTPPDQAVGVVTEPSTHTLLWIRHTEVITKYVYFSFIIILTTFDSVSTLTLIRANWPIKLIVRLTWDLNLFFIRLGGLKKYSQYLLIIGKNINHDDDCNEVMMCRSIVAFFNQLLVRYLNATTKSGRVQFPFFVRSKCLGLYLRQFTIVLSSHMFQYPPLHLTRIWGSSNTSIYLKVESYEILFCEKRRKVNIQTHRQCLYRDSLNTSNQIGLNVN